MRRPLNLHAINGKGPLGWVLGIALWASLSGAVWGQAGKIAIDRPGDREFVKDLANVLRPEDRKKIVEIADKLLTDKATPIIVVTLPSMRPYGGDGMRIETFARLLFDQWGIGHEKLDGQLWNTGILVLVSVGDRKARIELGAGWKRDKDDLAAQIMNERMVPHFREGDFSTGIVNGVESLEAMARGLALPRPPLSPWKIALVVGVVGLAIFTVVSLIRRGSCGWAWAFWGVVFALLGLLIYILLSGQRRSGGGSFSGGSFGGGFSGGGGATGSW